MKLYVIFGIGCGFIAFIQGIPIDTAAIDFNGNSLFMSRKLGMHIIGQPAFYSALFVIVGSFAFKVIVLSCAKAEYIKVTDIVPYLVKAFNNSDYLFGKCIGPSVVVEYINDSIEIVYANDEFQMLNMSDFSTIDFKNPLSSPFEESEVKVIEEAIKETVKKGTYKLEHYFKRTDKHFRIKNTLITRSSANAFIFIELSDLS